MSPTGTPSDTAPQPWRIATLIALLILLPGFILTAYGLPEQKPLYMLLGFAVLVLNGHAWQAFPVATASAMAALTLAGFGWAHLASPPTALPHYFVTLLILLSAVAAVNRRRMRRRFLRLEQVILERREQRHVNDHNTAQSEKVIAALQKKLDRYAKLQSVAEALAQTSDLQQVGDLVTGEAFALIPKADACSLLMVDADRKGLALAASRRKSSLPALPEKHGDIFDEFVLRNQRPLLVEDVQKDFRFPAAARGRKVRSLIACPLFNQETVSGILRLDSEADNLFSQDDLRFLDILSNLTATALTNAHLFLETRRLATTDGLTGLLLRAPFLELLERETTRAARTRDPLSLLVIDVDQFKRYNDTYGHTSGDAVLRSIGELIRGSLRQTGTAARLGGEEFAVLLTHTDKENAKGVAERIRLQVQENLREPTVVHPQPLTVSIGIATFLEDGLRGVELLRVADQRLYKAKEQGRNRTCLS